MTNPKKPPEVKDGNYLTKPTTHNVSLTLPALYILALILLIKSPLISFWVMSTIFIHSYLNVSDVIPHQDVSGNYLFPDFKTLDGSSYI